MCYREVGRITRGGLELRPLPSTGITRLPRYYEPLRHPSASGLSLTGVRLIIPDHALGFPVLRALSLCTCCRHYPGAAAGCIPRSSHPAVSAFPGRVTGSACTSTFSRLARRALALRPAHSRGHQFVTRYPKASDISSPPCLLRLLPAGANRRVGLAPTGKRRLVTAQRPILYCAISISYDIISKFWPIWSAGPRAVSVRGEGPKRAPGS